MQNKFGMDKIQGSHKLSGYMYYSLSEDISHHLNYLYVKGIGCVFKHKNILWMKTNLYPNKIYVVLYKCTKIKIYIYKMTFHLVTVVPMTPITLKSTSKLRPFLHPLLLLSSHSSFLTLIRLNYDNGFHNTLDYNLPL